jgi:hypothetical protein
MLTCIPELTVPIPSGREEILTLHAKVEAMFNTSEFLAQFGTISDLIETDKVAARSALYTSAAHSVNGVPMAKLDDIKSSAAVGYLKKLLSEYDENVIKSAVQIRNYVTNKLIEETTNNDPKIRIRALELLGKVGDVGLFVERSEITVRHKTTVELEASIKDRISKLMDLRSKTVDAVEVNPTPLRPVLEMEANQIDD